jgi:methylase of polypeptide subunit release factors
VNDLLYRARTRLMCTLLKALHRTGKVMLGGLELEVAEGVHHPAPVFGLGFTALQEAALAQLPPRAKVLELGTGAGFWALAAAREGHVVTATELPEVPLPVETAQKLGLDVRFLQSDLFDALPGERFDAVLFNPPFHDAEPRTPEERAWSGASTVRRFLSELAAHLSPEGAAFILFPRADRARYFSELSAFDTHTVASQWFPLLGRVELLRLAPRSRGPTPTRAPSARGSSRPATGR